MVLDLSPLEKAINSLDDILAQTMNPYIRDGAIQRFEYTFELTWKSLQRHLKVSGVEAGSPREVFRAAFKSKLILEVERWFEFLKARNLTVHTYNQNLAEEVYLQAKDFAPYARAVLARLKEENARPPA